MAAESLLGGTAGQNLSDATKALLDAFLGDTQGGTAQTTALAGGGALVVGKGANNETQGAVVAGTAAVTAEIKDGNLTLGVTLPAGVSLAFEGITTATTLAEVQKFFENKLSEAFGSNPTPQEQAHKQSVEKALDVLFQALGSSNLVVQHIKIVDAPSVATTAEGKEIVFDGSGTKATEVLALELAGMKPGDVLVLKNVANAVLAGPGTVKVDGSGATRLVGDLFDQHIIGGGGNDTLIGGGGNDTLEGGAGSDVFGFIAGGNYTIKMDKNDTLAFQIAGINSLAELLQYVTATKEVEGGVRYEFGDAGSITILGISPSEITADMVKFTI
jgi:Ca2+-binding RTX toxin-like protein